MKIECIALDNLPIIQKGDDLGELIFSALEEKGLMLKDRDIVVVTEKIVSKAEGRVVDLKDVIPSDKAKKLAKITGKDPELVELILGESKEVLAVGDNFIITEVKDGVILANSGIDQSNVKDGKAKLLPTNPDRSAEKIRAYLEKKSEKQIGVVIADSVGRPFRHGSIGIAIGVSGAKALWDRRGEKDMLGRELKVTRVAVADSLATTANLVMGEAAEYVPVVVIRGFNLLGKGKAGDLVREKERDIFRW
ncbi:MAG: coenzyme F420-0:L-glutamate ligase [Candidatus Hydrothermarchaeales archaeon]